MKKFILVCAAMLSLTVTKAQTPFTTLINDGTNGYQSVLDMVYYDGSGNPFERYCLWNDTANFRALAFLPTYSVTNNNFVLTSNSVGRVSPTPISALGGLQGNLGSATVSGTLLQTAYVITHGLSYTPTAVFIQPKSANASALSYVSNITSTQFTVNFLSVPIIGTNNISFNWVAYK